MDGTNALLQAYDRTANVNIPILINSSGATFSSSVTLNSRLLYSGTRVGNINSDGSILYIGENEVSNILNIDLVNQRVGIGTTSPLGKLHSLSTTSDYAIVADNTLSGTQNFILFRAGANIGDIIRPSGTNDVRLNSNFGSIVFGTDGSGTAAERMRINNNGNVGIGTTAPNSLLEVNRTITFSSIDTYAQLVVKTTSGANGKLLNIGVDETNSVSFIQSLNRGTDAMPLSLQRYGGNVGIGTASPTDPLTIGGAQTGLSINSASTGDAYVRWRLDGTVYNDAYVDRGTGNFLIGPTVSSALILKTNNTERMRITSGGSVLIGTTTEGFLGKLQVAGSVAITGQYNTVLPSSSFSYFDGSGQVVSSSSNASALYLDTTWNTTGNPDGIYLNVTNTASGASSKLLNLKVGSVSQFSVSKGGAIQTSDPTNGTARPWKLGDARSGGISTDSYIIVEVNGVTYSIPALNGLP
jgi:hypothetical protein